jgi:hypothetical protein
VRKIILILFLASFSFSYSQNSLSDYSYISIPDRFDFLQENDQYDLNSLTKYLFNKYGFHAFFENEIPDNLSRCEGLKADVEDNSGFIYTKFQIVISDCKGNELYRSPEGKSKQKDYRKAYHQALRETFKNIERLGVNQKTFVKNKILQEKETTSVENSVDEKSVIPTSNYRYKEYTLINNQNGYTIWKKNKKIGEAIPASVKGYYVVKTEDFIGIGIQTEEYFSIERYEANAPKLLPMLFKKLKD